MLITDAEVEGVAPVDVRVEAGGIAEVGQRLARREGETRLDAGGGALLPGLHDHHLHLFSMAAEENSVRCGPPDVCDGEALARALAGAGGSEWIRGTGYHESVAGALDRSRLDALRPDRPVRIQHRSGALWVVNSAGAERLGLDRDADESGIERDSDGRATGRLFRLDRWMRGRIGTAEPPSLAAVSRRLAGFGVTGVTDATATNGCDSMRALRAAIDAGELRQRVVVMGTAELPDAGHARITRGALKVMLDERDLPPFEDLRDALERAHRDGRPVAIHCVTRAELVLAAAALTAAGSRVGDRIEHAGVAPPDVLPTLRELALTVVTQPNFILERGDAYLADVEPRDRPWLYRGAGLLAAGIPLGGGTDAPFGGADPWTAMRAAVTRRSRGGATLEAGEALTPERALALFTSPAETPGAPPRRVVAGESADLCLLDRPWAEVRSSLSSDHVAATIRSGDVL